MDRLEEDLKDHFTVIRLDIASDLGKYARKKYDGKLVPTFMVFDTRGTVIWRHSGSVPQLETILSLGL